MAHRENDVEGRVHAALGVEGAGEGALARRLVELGGFREPREEPTRLLFERLGSCICEFVGLPPDLWDHAEVANSLLGCAVPPNAEEEWAAYKRDLETWDFDGVLRLFLIDHVIPRLGRAGLIDLWPPERPEER